MRKMGLALSGGGARGLAHIGVLKVLEEMQFPLHMLAGTSMGGIIAAIYAAGRSAAEIERIACSLRLLDIIQRDRSGLGLIGQDKMAARMREALGGDLTFAQLRLPLALVAVNLETGQEVIIREGSVVEGLLATAAVPIVFPPRRLGGSWLVDGGVLDPVPFGVVRGMGADHVVAVHTLHDFSDGLRTESPPAGRGAEAVIRLLVSRTGWASMLEVAERSQAIMVFELVKQRLRESPPDLLIEVPLKGVGLLDLDQVRMCIQAGEEAARQHLPELAELRDAAGRKRLADWWRSAIDGLTARMGRKGQDVS